MKVLELERRRRRMSGRALARSIQFHESWISHMEAGRWRPTPGSPVARGLEQFFGRSLEELLTDIPDSALAQVVAGTVGAVR
jgi:ribosome-binding protein aMBF1 (putative translation factor)